MRRARLLVALIALAVQMAVTVPVSSQGVIVGATEFSPPEFLPGEAVTAVAMLDPGALPWSPATLETGLTEDGESAAQVLSVALEKRKGSPALVVRFVAWRAGPGYLPETTIGGLEIPRIRFECWSALAEGNFKAPEPMPQLNLPGLYPRIYALAGLLLVAAIAGVTVMTKATPWFRAFMARKAYLRARREFDELLDRLGAAAAGPAAWAALCAGLRAFAGLRAGIDLSAMTASEVLSLPAGAVPGNAAVDLAGILAMGDEARFAGRTDVKIEAGIGMARSVADRIDEATHAVV